MASTPPAFVILDTAVAIISTAANVWSSVKGKEAFVDTLTSSVAKKPLLLASARSFNSVPLLIGVVLMASIIASTTTTLACFWVRATDESAPSLTPIATIASLTTSTTVATAAAARW